MAAPVADAPVQGPAAAATGLRRLVARYCESRIAIAGLVMLALLICFILWVCVCLPLFMKLS